MRNILTAVIFFISLGPAQAAYLDLAWDPNTEADLAGYAVYYGTQPGTYGTSIDVGDTTTYRLDGLLEGVTYYVAVTAYDVAGNESDFSSEVSGMAVADGASDTDGDGLPDNWEMSHFGDLIEGPQGDYEGDGASNLSEYQHGTDPANPDTDADQMPDGWEIRYGLDPLDPSDAQADSDGDGITNVEEYLAGTDPWNAPPVADAGPDQTVAEGVKVTLDGSNSSDPDDGIASYLWEQTAGLPVILSDPTGPRPSFTAPDVGSGGESLTFTLTVTDNGGLESTDSCFVNITWVNIPPTADAGPDQTVDEGTVVALDGSNSFDPDDGIASYIWEQIGGEPVVLSDPAAAQPTFLSPSIGTGGGSLTFQLTVVDGGGLKSSDTCVVNVAWSNAPPTADAGLDRTVVEGTTVELDGSASSDGDDGIVSYTWEQISGPPVALADSTAAKTSFVTPPVDSSGAALAFRLTVTDGGGLQGSDQVTVAIEDNGITGFPEDAITLTTSTGEPIAVKMVEGGSLVRLEAKDPSTLAHANHAKKRPRHMAYGVWDIQVKADRVGGSARLTLYFPEPVPRKYKWFKYHPETGWENYTRYAVFNEARDQVTVTLFDGGPGDEDGTANGIIVDPSALGTDPWDGQGSDPTDSPEKKDPWYDLRGCFVSTVWP